MTASKKTGRCGRCGLWANYPDDHPENWAGMCLWYQHRLMEDDVFEQRECEDFFERVPEMTAKDHLDYKIKRDDLGDAHKKARRSLVISIVALVLSAGTLTLKILDWIQG